MHEAAPTACQDSQYSETRERCWPPPRPSPRRWRRTGTAAWSPPALLLCCGSDSAAPSSFAGSSCTRYAEPSWMMSARPLRGESGLRWLVPKDLFLPPLRKPDCPKTTPPLRLLQRMQRHAALARQLQPGCSQIHAQPAVFCGAELISVVYRRALRRVVFANQSSVGVHHHAQHNRVGKIRFGGQRNG